VAPRTQRIVLTLGAVATTLMLALLALNLVDIERQRRIAARQEERVQSLAGQADAGLGDVRAGLKQGLPPVRAGLRRADGLVRALLEHRGPSAIAAAGELARDLTTGNRAVALFDRGNELLAELERSGAAGDVDTLARVVTELLETGRSTQADADVLRAQTIDFKRKSLAIQRETLALQREALGVLHRSLAVQEETLEHARRIDERTGGAVDPTAP
jgi:hypothetical protein